MATSIYSSKAFISNMSITHEIPSIPPPDTTPNESGNIISIGKVLGSTCGGNRVPQPGVRDLTRSRINLYWNEGENVGRGRSRGRPHRFGTDPRNRYTGWESWVYVHPSVTSTTGTIGKDQIEVFKLYVNTGSIQWESDEHDPITSEYYYDSSKFRGLWNRTKHDVISSSATKEFEDFAFDVQMLLNNESTKLDKGSLLNEPPFIKYDPEYNFYIKGYEGAIAGDSPTQAIPESLLPSIYVFGSEVSNENKDGTLGAMGSATDYAKHLTLQGRITNIFVDIVSDKTGQKIGESDGGQYFEKYIRAISSPPIVSPLVNSAPDLNVLALRFKHQIFPLDGIKLLKDYNSRKHLFPMYTEISFQTDSFTEIAQILAESNLTGDLIKWIINPNNPAKEVMNIAQTGMLINSTDETEEVCTFEKQVDTWNVDDWLKFGVNNPVPDPLNRRIQGGGTGGIIQSSYDGVFMGGRSVAASIAHNPYQRLYRTLMVTLFYSKLLQLTKNNMRTYEDILNGKKAMSETIFYEVAKFEGNTTSDSNSHLQSFYFVNSNEINVLNFVDTQVKYNKQYTYVVYAYQMVLGNKYKFTGGYVISNLLRWTLINNASYKIFKIPLSKFSGRVLDRPPVFPDVDFIPFRAVNDKIKISMNSNVGLYDLNPIPIKNEDDALITALRESQKKPSGPLEYKTDDKTVTFEIFRTDKLPATYRDFADNQIAIVQTKFRKDGDQFLPSTNFIDSIEPNIVYYYTIRLKDIHGHISNPSAIYKVKMVDNQGTIYPLIEVVDLIPPGMETRTPSKPMKKYVQIIPALPQTLLNERELFPNPGPRMSPQITNAFNALPLGVTNEKVWNEKYKIRFSSKKSGKKFDLNIEFKNRGDVDDNTPT